jgi:hypothetical protein
MRRTASKIALGAVVAMALGIVFGEVVVRAIYDDITGTPSDLRDFLQDIGVVDGR